MLPLLHLVLLPISPSPAAAKSCTQFSSSAVRSGVLLCTQHCAPSQPRLRLLRPRPPLPLQSPTTCRAEKARTGSHALLGSSPPHNNYRGALMRRRGGEKSALLISFSLLLPPPLSSSSPSHAMAKERTEENFSSVVQSREVVVFRLSERSE